VTELSEQQKRVESRLNDSWGRTLKYNDEIDTRAKSIVTASSVIVGIVVAAKFLPKETAGFNVETVLLGVVCLCSVLMYWYAIDVWRYTAKTMPGSVSVDALYDEYIAVDVVECFNNSLIDLCDAMKQCVAENQRKSATVEKIAKVFQVQVALLALAVGWSGGVGLLSAMMKCFAG
tara:strand:- start:87 stop:614 length:528 start_codon:yes stop_codon:yes gene_type:complete